MRTKHFLIIGFAILIVAFIVYGDKHLGNKSCNNTMQCCASK